ncbi:LysE family translocator [Pelovirga terrestris]|uniref:LysE family translocator n=1 Tax=Pelovirga terrestris TaxID=2771352 RepID=A0A8J6UGU2_9BACT|nr:LysE family translocator [Pelovirga terrestris]MBD1400378.1 LysE family translocator [Pelovirga terrestris]
MIPVETIITFFSAAVLLGLAPGPDNLFVLTQSALRGRGPGLVVVLGLCSGLLVHTAVVAFGVAIIFQSSAVAFTLLKLIGAGYLVYLAWQAFRAPPETLQGEAGVAPGYWRYYRRGVIMNLTNPKVSIFFLAFLPQFADPSYGAVVYQLLLLGGLFILATVLVFGGIALLAGSIGQWLNRSQRLQLVLNRLAGAVLVALAIRLATAQR